MWGISSLWHNFSLLSVGKIRLWTYLINLYANRNKPYNSHCNYWSKRCLWREMWLVYLKQNGFTKGTQFAGISNKIKQGLPPHCHVNCHTVCHSVMKHGCQQFWRIFAFRTFTLNGEEERQWPWAASAPDVLQRMSATLSTGSCHLIEETVSNVSLILANTIYTFYFSTLSWLVHPTLNCITRIIPI